MTAYLCTGQATCHDTDGRVVSCTGSGQDAEFSRGIPWPVPRFEPDENMVIDKMTGLIWMRNANMAEIPLRWQEAINYIAEMNKENLFGFSDWRLPNRRELRSLMSHQTKKPALPKGYPFINVFNGWYWTSTTAAINTAYAWYIHMEGARMFYGHKEQFCLCWPVRGKTEAIPVTGQSICYDTKGEIIPCTGTGQDGELRSGARWPEPRFEKSDDIVFDRLTNLCWRLSADLAGKTLTWDEALKVVKEFNMRERRSYEWRLPNINELESLVDCSAHSPALPDGHPFKEVREGYWSSTTSIFEPDWAWALYLTKGAVGVGQKKGAHFHVWPTSDAIGSHVDINGKASKI